MASGALIRSGELRRQFDHLGTRPLVEHRQLIGGIEEAPVLVLPGERKKPAHDLAQRGQGDGRTVHKAAVPSLPGETPRDYHLPWLEGGEVAQLPGDVGESGLVDIEDGLHRGVVGRRTDEALLGTLPHQ